MAEAGLFDGVLARGRVREAVADDAWLQAMLDAEAALARASAAAGLLSAQDAETIAAACGAAHYDVAELGAQAAATGNPAAPLVKALTARVDGAAAGHVHSGATSQDIVDTAAMLVAHRALGPLLEDLEGAADAAARMAAEHRATVLAGRTLLQQALPVTLGLKAAGWLVGLDEAIDRLTAVRDERLAVQLGGAAGTLASLGDRGVDVMRRHGPRARPRRARAAVAHDPHPPGRAGRRPRAPRAGVVAKAARDVTLLAQTEVAEVAEGAAGGSSTMPHKRNPVAAVSAAACAGAGARPGRDAPRRDGARARARSRQLARGVAPAHRAAALLRLGRLVAARRAWRSSRSTRTPCAANLGLTEGLLLAERVSTELAAELGRLPAHEAVAARRAAGAAPPSGGFAAALAEQPEIRGRISAERLAELLDPAGYLGSTDDFIDRALRAHDAREARA